MVKRAHLYYRNPCPGAEEAKSFLEEHGVLVIIRDIAKNPLTKKELSFILGYLDPRHYLDTASSVYRKSRLDKALPPREDLFALIAEHPELLKHPIILAGRLITIGNNRRQLIEMFQLPVSDNGSGNDDGSSAKSRKR